MFCTKCGSSVGEKQAFCSNCGEAVVSFDFAVARDSEPPSVTRSARRFTSEPLQEPAVLSNHRTPHAMQANRLADKFSGLFAKKPRKKLTTTAMVSLAIAALVAGGTMGYVLNMTSGVDTQGRASTMPAVASAAEPEQVSVSARDSVNGYSWDELATISDAIAVANSESEALKIAKDFNLVGESGKLDGTQTKDVRLANGNVAQAQIIGFAHDTRSDGGKIGITFMFRNCVAEHDLNANCYTDGGWKQSGLRKWMNSDFVNDLPNDLRSAMVYASKATNNSGKTTERSSVTTTGDLLWVPSFTELVGYVDMASYEEGYEPIPASRRAEFQTYFEIWNAEGVQYKLFRDKGVKLSKSNGALVKRQPAGDACTWWGRSASPGEWDKALSVSDEGKVQKSTSSPSESLGVAPCFCIGRNAGSQVQESDAHYVDDSITYTCPYEVRYVQVHEDNSSRIDVTYIDKSTNVENNDNRSVNVDNNLDVHAEVNQDDPGYSDSPADPETENAPADSRTWADEDDPSELGVQDSDGEEDEDESGNSDEADETGARDDCEDEGESDNADEHGESDDAERSDNQDHHGKETEGSPSAIDAGSYVDLTGMIEVRHSDDYDATTLVLPRPITVNDSNKSAATSDRIRLDSSLSEHEDKQVTVRCALGVDPEDQTASDGVTRIHATGDVQVIGVSGAGENPGFDKAADNGHDFEDRARK